ncbi:MAG TPA: immunoglobulin domain-containing protein [Candidatus Hydrogenedentes bacterium]|nr:immunoglobulin domain-containing protein [Candidatus Hydrogenedentota bacterium]
MAGARSEVAVQNILNADDDIPNLFTYDGDGNGIPDLAHFRLLDAVLHDSSAPHYFLISSTWTLNLIQMQMDNTNPGQCEFQALLAGYSCSDVLEAIPAAFTLAEPGLAPWMHTVLNRVRIETDFGDYNSDAGQYLQATADLDGDGYSNLEEYEAFNTSFDAFVTAAKDPTIVPGGECVHNCPLEILQHPQGGSVYEGSSFTLTIVVEHIEGSGQYYWYHDGMAVEGATNTLTLSPVSLDDAGWYWCMILDDRGADGIATELSSMAELRVGQAMHITTAPVGATVTRGGAHTFEVGVEGGLGTLHYQWKHNGIPTGVDSPTLTITNARLENAGIYQCVISDDLSAITSPAAELIVIESCYTTACEQTCSGSGFNAGFETAYRSIITIPLIDQDPDIMDADDNLIVDAAQARLMDTILANNTLPYHCCVRNAYFHNLDEVNKVADEVPPVYFLIIPRDAFVKMATGLMTVGEEATASVLTNLGAHIPGFPEIDLSVFDRSAEQYLAFNGDPDEDGVPNVSEYLAHVVSAEDFDAFVEAALDPEQRENGGGCEPCDQTMDILLMGDLWPKRAFRWDTLAQVLRDHGYGHYRVAGSISTSQWISATLMAENENNELGRIDLAFERFPDVQLIQLTLGSMDIITLAMEKSLNSMSSSALNDALNDIQASIQTVVNYILSKKPGLEILLADIDYLNPDLIKATYPKTYELKTVSQAVFNNALVSLGRKILAIAQRTDHCHYVQSWGVLQYYMGNSPVWEPEGVPFPGSADTNFEPYPGGNPNYSCLSSAYENEDGYSPTAQSLYYIYDNYFHQFYELYLTPDAEGEGGEEGEEEGLIEGQEEGVIEGEGGEEGQEEGILEGEGGEEGQEEGSIEGEGGEEGTEEGVLEGEGGEEGMEEGILEGEGGEEGMEEGVIEGEGGEEGQEEGIIEGEGQGEGEGETPEGTLEISPANGALLDFGRTAIKSSSELTVLLRNNTHDTVEAYIRMFSGGFMHVTSGSRVILPAGEERTVTIRFSPLVRQLYSDLLFVEGGGKEFILHMQGTGVYIPFISCGSESSVPADSSFSDIALMALVCVVLTLTTLRQAPRKS